MSLRTITAATLLAIAFTAPLAAPLAAQETDHSKMNYGTMTMEGMAQPKGDTSASSQAFAGANAKMHGGMDITFTGNADVDFVRGMIAHHQGAIDMAKIELEYGIQPHRFGRYMRSDDPEFEPKAADVIGLYLDPPQHAAVFAADEKTAIQALDRLDPVLPLSPGRAERHGFEYYRHGTLSLFAALNTKTGEVLGQTVPRHTSAAFVEFLGEIVASQPRQCEIHVILDNLSTHKTRAVAAFLEAHPNVHLHFTPTYASWLNQVELWFGRIERELLTRGIFTSVHDLARQIRRYIRHYNDVAKPIRWKYSDPTRRIAGSTSVSTGH